MKKKVLSLTLALILCLTLAAPAFAADSDFVIYNGILQDYKGPGGNVTIPDSVTSIGDAAFVDCGWLTSVTIPNSVTSIGHLAFSGCGDLTGVTIPNSVTSIGDCAFMNCVSLVSVTIPNSVTSIGENAFAGCGRLTSMTIPNSVTSIGYSVFCGCTSLASVTIPSSVTSIGESAFEGCYSLTSVTIPSSVTNIGERAFAWIESLTDIYYGGTEAQWKKIKITANNTYLDPLPNATIHYNSTIPGTSTTPTTPTTPTTQTVADFADVAASAWYATPVAWALEKGITNGTGVNKFSPEKTCNTSEILTFLWRACGSPKAEAAGSFTDVAANAWYADAAAWAKSKDMVSGSALSPETPCTRSSAVMFIWQAMGKPEASSKASFTDVPADADYAAAVAWAVEKGVTNGTSDTAFSPDTICNRGHIVTFLQRAFA